MWWKLLLFWSPSTQLECWVHGDTFDMSPSSTGLHGEGVDKAPWFPHKVADGTSFFRNTLPGEFGDLWIAYCCRFRNRDFRADALSSFLQAGLKKLKAEQVQ